MVEYSGVALLLTDSFTFEITCPVLVTSSFLVTPIEAEIDYDVASGKMLSLTLPEVDFNPAKCFTLLAFSVLD